MAANSSHDESRSRASGFDAPEIDLYEVERESVIAMLERERRSLTSSLIALSLYAVAVAFLPEAGLIGYFLLLRTASFLFTRSAVSRLERRMLAREPLGIARATLFAGMCLTGVTLALMLWPVPPSAPPAAVATLYVVTVVAVTLISVTLAALPGSRDAMLGSFWATASLVIWFHPQLDTTLILVVTLMVLGIRVYSSNTGRHITSAAQVLVENRQLSEELAEALAHAEFLSWRDPLTGLFNRRKLFEITRNEQSREPFQLMTIDLDRFKAINDRYGHAAGDHVLIATADEIRDMVDAIGGRDRHLGFRLGGEEFLVMTRGLYSGEAEAAAERLRQRIAAIVGPPGPFAGLSVTASIGLTEWRAGEDLDEALQRADMACYEAKDEGRNAVRRAA